MKRSLNRLREWNIKSMILLSFKMLSVFIGWMSKEKIKKMRMIMMKEDDDGYFAKLFSLSLFLPLNSIQKILFCWRIFFIRFLHRSFFLHDSLIISQLLLIHNNIWKRERERENSFHWFIWLSWTKMFPSKSWVRIKNFFSAVKWDLHSQSNSI